MAHRGREVYSFYASIEMRVSFFFARRAVFPSLCFFDLLSFENLLCFGVVCGIETSLPRSEEKLKPGAQLCLELSVKCVGLAGVRVLLGACVFLLRCVNTFLLILEPPTTPARC